MASNYHATVTANTQNYQANFGRAAAANDAFVRSLREVHQGATAIDGPIGAAANRVDALQGIFRSSGVAIAGFSVALAAVGAGLIGNLVLRQGEALKELQNMARMSNTTTEAFEGYAFAVQAVGLESEQLADISKDAREKLGDFIASGGGEFADFFENIAPQVGLTAEALQDLSGPDILFAVKNAMDQVNVSAEEQIFYLEGIASDASKLQPLLENNGEEFKRLAERGRQLSGALSTIESDNLLEAAGHSKEFEKAFSSLTRQLSASLAPAVSKTLSTLVDGVLIARKALSNLNNQELYDRKHFTELHEHLVSINTEIQSLQTGNTNNNFLDKFKSDAVIAAERAKKLNNLLLKRNDIERQMVDIQDRQIQRQKEQQALEALETAREQRTKNPIDNTDPLPSDDIDPFTGLSRGIEQLNTHNEAKKAIIGAQNAWYVQSVEDTENSITEIQYNALQARYGHMDFYQQNQLGLFLSGQKSIESAGKAVLRSMISDQLKYYLTTTRGAGVAAIAQAAASAPFPANLPGIGWATAKTVALNAAIAAIQVPNFAGVAHAGMTSIPREGTYLLDGGERIVKPEQNRDLTQFLQHNGSTNTQFVNPAHNTALTPHTINHYSVEAPMHFAFADLESVDAATTRRLQRVVDEHIVDRLENLGRG